jgi:hypothetical protein
MDAPPPPVETDTGADGEPAEITAIHRASGTPFRPPPGAPFPPPPAQLGNAGTAAKRKVKLGAGSKKKIFMLAGGGGALVVLAAAAFFILKPAELPPPPPRPKPKPVAKPVEVTPVEPAPAPVVEAVVEKSAAPVVVEAAAPEPVVPAPPPPPPVASAAFKNWVESLKISGVRAGASTRVFIGGTAYTPGDLVNPQLGISFDGYNAETRMLIFKDKTGAKVERRN